MFIVIERILCYKASLSKFKIIEDLQNIFSDYNGIKIKINKRKISGNFPNIWKFKNPWVKKKSKEKLESICIL